MITEEQVNPARMRKVPTRRAVTIWSLKMVLVVKVIYWFFHSTLKLLPFAVSIEGWASNLPLRVAMMSA